MSDSNSFSILWAIVLWGVSTTTNAELIDRGNGLIYDEEQDITWLQDLNYIITSGYDSDGLVKWQEANDWAESLTFRGFDDWRLPTTPQMDSTCISVPTIDLLTYQDCTGGELGYLYYTHLNNNYGTPENYGDYLNNNYGPFIDGSGTFPNVAATKGYWTSTQFDPTLDWPEDMGSVPTTDDYHWLFYANWGTKFVFQDGNSRYVTAVHDGDVGGHALPGDINFDGQVSVADYLLLMQFVLGIGSIPTADEFNAGDMNLNSQLDAGDLVIHSRTVMGLI